ncbi:MAG: J domain-containing protein [Aquabacterium sp.]
MNHYERLKVSQDAPAEVIRAAYRALATKLHPDRQGGETGPDDAMHTQMAALNSAYEVLIDPKLRRDYDATLEPTAPRIALESVLLHEDVPPAASSRVDMDWLTPKAAKPTTLWPPSQRMMIMGGGGLAVLILGLTGVLWKAAGQHQVERALSDQYASHPVDANAPPAVDDVQTAEATPRRQAPQTDGGARRPSVEELSRMSDEELLKVLPTLDRDTPAEPAAAVPQRSRRGGNAHHPLDGKPLALRTETHLIDPLAPNTAAAKSKSRRP